MEAVTPDPVEPPGQWLRDVRDHASGPVQVQLSCDWFVGFPVEMFVEGQPAYVGPEMLGLSQALTDDLIAHQRWWEEHASFDDDGERSEGDVERAGWRRWGEDGAYLVERLRTELGPGYEVTWV